MLQLEGHEDDTVLVAINEALYELVQHSFAYPQSCVQASGYSGSKNYVQCCQLIYTTIRTLHFFRDQGCHRTYGNKDRV